MQKSTYYGVRNNKKVRIMALENIFFEIKRIFNFVFNSYI